MSKILLALSGGVDSSVAGHILKQRGHQIAAAFLTHPALDPEPARRAAQELGVELVIEDISTALEREVFPAFEQAYASGHTPNPCVICNPSVKFSTLLDTADRLGCEYVATGHYARICDGRLYKARSANDQSYMLCRLDRAQLARCIFPLGDFESKDDVRAFAASHGVSAADRPDSMEICFIPDGDYAAWLRARGLSDTPGDFVDEGGNVIGRHTGILGYTVGMRRGLGVSADERLYVKHIDTITNRITLVKENQMYTDCVCLSSLKATGLPLEELPREVYVKLRHTRREELAEFLLSSDFSRAELHLSTPVRIPAPGQFAAIYVGDMLAASGIIEP